MFDPPGGSPPQIQPTYGPGSNLRPFTAEEVLSLAGQRFVVATHGPNNVERWLVVRVTGESATLAGAVDLDVLGTFDGDDGEWRANAFLETGREVGHA